MNAHDAEQLDAKMRMAKRRFTLAALACLRQAADAQEQVEKALAEVEAAREALRALQETTKESKP
jgi:outer membrane protein TolC